MTCRQERNKNVHTNPIKAKPLKKHIASSERKNKKGSDASVRFYDCCAAKGVKTNDSRSSGRADVITNQKQALDVLSADWPRVLEKFIKICSRSESLSSGPVRNKLGNIWKVYRRSKKANEDET